MQNETKRRMRRWSYDLWSERSLLVGHNGRIGIWVAVLRRCSEVLRRGSNGSHRWNWSSACHEKGVAVIPNAGQSSTLDTRSAQQLSAASMAERVQRRFCARRAQGLALTKGGRWRRISTLKMIIYQLSTIRRAKTGSAIRIGLLRLGVRRSLGACQRPNGVSWRGGAGRAAASGKSLSLVVGDPNMDSFSSQRGCSPSGARLRSGTATTTRGTLKAAPEEAEREDGAGAAKTVPAPSNGAKHGGGTQEQTGSTRFSLHRQARPPGNTCPSQFELEPVQMV